MEIENDEKQDRFLLLFVPTVNQNSDVFVCCTIIMGNQFISVIMLIISFIYFYNALFGTKLSAIIDLFLCLVYFSSGFFLLLATFNQKYIYAKIPYSLYEITFFVKLFVYIILAIFDLINVIRDLKYLTKLFGVILGGGIELGIMSYFIYVMYCFLIVIKFYNNDINRIGAEHQELLNKKLGNEEFKELKN